MTKFPILFSLLLFLIACGDTPEAEAPETETANPSPSETEPAAETPRESPDTPVVSTPDDYEPYIGLEYQEPPEGLREFAGWLMGSPEEQPVYGVSWMVEASCESQPCPPGTTSMLWFQEVEVGQQPSYRVVDVVGVPDLPEDFSEQILSTCQQGEEIDPEILAIVAYDSDQEILPAIQAWRANQEAETLEEIPPDEVQCYNPGYGL